MSERLCPCGKPARRKYCSERCADRYYAREWRARNKADHQARMKEYFRIWVAKNKSKMAAYQKKYRRGTKRQECLRRWYQRNRDQILANRRAAYHADPERRRLKKNQDWRTENAAKIKQQHRARKAARLAEEFSLLQAAISNRPSKTCEP